MAEGDLTEGNPPAEKQKTLIKELLKKGLKTGDAWFLISSRWFKEWKNHVFMDDGSSSGSESECLSSPHEKPGPIDNSIILKNDTSQEKKLLKDQLVEELDFVLVPEEAWILLVMWYGIAEDQEPIKRFVIEQGMFVKHFKVEIYLINLKLGEMTNSENVFTRGFSRICTIGTLEKEMRKLFSVPDDVPVRLWNKYMSNTFEQLSNKDTTLADSGLYQGQIIVLEVQDKNGDWPRKSGISDVSAPLSSTLGGPNMKMYYGGASSSSSYDAGSSALPGLCGLSNLGNTCFMNSALQCLSNVPTLTQYFLSNRWKTELNERNPLGMRGQIARSYADLIRTIWSGRSNYTAPRNFKVALGRFAPQFSGFEQQDSQELMAFLLDGLHEDLNRILTKPYIEQQDADNRPDSEVANESWTNYRRRNDSIVVDIFHGLYKSTLVCPDCSKVSITFDPFGYLSLPLPSKTMRDMEVYFVSANPSSNIQQLRVAVSKQGTVSDLCSAVAKLVNVVHNKMVVVDVYSHRFHKVFPMEDTLSNIMERDDIFIYETTVDPMTCNDHYILPVYCKQRRSTNSDYVQWELFGHPLLISVPKDNLTYSVLYEIILTSMKRYVTIPGQSHHWWINDKIMENGVDSANENNSENFQNKQMFQLSLVGPYGNDEKDELSAGEEILQLTKQSYLAVKWNPVAKNLFYNEAEAEKTIRSPSMNLSLMKQPIQLGECLQLFTHEERLSERDPWYCPCCKEFQQATKKFDLWSLPEVLVIHLKRFHCNRYWREKIDTMVEFPTEGLDLRNYIINEVHGPAIYDLLAITNHFGGMGGGHYTAFAKNKETGKWYNFDDYSVTETTEDSVVTRAAYVLVYQRRSTSDPTRRMMCQEKMEIN